MTENQALVWLTRGEMDLILEGLACLHSDYEGTSTLPQEKMDRLVALDNRLANLPGYLGTDN